jgi:hypothetical protein
MDGFNVIAELNAAKLPTKVIIMTTFDSVLGKATRRLEKPLANPWRGQMANLQRKRRITKRGTENI